MLSRNERGFTLPELLITVVLMGLVMSGISTALIQALKIPSDGRARSNAATARTFATTTMSDDIANAKLVETLKPGTPNGDEYRVASTCNTNAAPDRLYRLTWHDGSRVEYRLRYSSYNPATARVELQRSDGGDFETLIAGFCKLSPVDPVLDVLTLTPGGDTIDGEDEAEDGEDGNFNPESAYANRRLRAEFKFRDTPDDAPTKVNIEAAPRSDCWPAGATPGGLDPQLPDCDNTPTTTVP